MAKQPKRNNRAADANRPSQAALSGQKSQMAGRQAIAPQSQPRRMSPARVGRLLKAADRGDCRALFDLYRELSTDAHIAADMGKRIRAVTGLPYAIVMPPNATASEQAQAELIQSFIQTCGQWKDVKAWLLSAIGYGFGAVEYMREYSGGMLRPQQFRFIPHRYFKLPTTTADNEYDGQTILLNDSIGDGSPLRENSWIVHTQATFPGELALSGLYRALIYPYIYKTYSATDLMEFLAGYGLPIIIGKYENEADRQTLVNAVFAIGRDARGVIPSKSVVEVMDGIKGQSDPFLALMRFGNEECSKAILGGTLTTSVDGRGSYAAAATHNDVRQDIMIDDAGNLDETLNHQLFAPMLAWNFADFDPDRMPRYKSEISDPVDLVQVANALSVLTNDVGMQIDSDWAHSKTGIPRASSPDKALNGRIVNASPAN